MDPLIYYGVGVPGLLLLIGLELRSGEFRDSTWGDRLRVRRNWSYLLAALLAITVVRLVSDGLGGLLPRPIAWRGPVAVEVAACFLAGELLNWVAHRAKHAHPFLWRFHFQHHRESRYSIWLVTHTHPLEVCFTGAWMSAVLVLCGFSPLATQCYLLFYSLANTYQHSSHDYSLGPLDWLIVNPAYHRHHHALGREGNYGSTLTVWDVVFGTARFPATRRADPALRYGIEARAGEPFGFEEELTWFLRPATPPPVEPWVEPRGASARLVRASTRLRAASTSGRLAP